MAADVATGDRRRPLLAGRLAAPPGLRPDDLLHDDRGRVGGRLPQQSRSRPSQGSARPVRRGGCWPARGRTPTRRPRSPGPRIDLDHEMVAWWTAGSGAVLPTSGRTGRTSSCGPRRPRNRISSCTKGSGCPGPGRSPHRHHCRSSRRRRALVGGPAGRRHRRLDRLRGPPAVGASGDQREDDARSLTWEWLPEEGAEPALVRGSAVRLTPTSLRPPSSPHSG